MLRTRTHAGITRVDMARTAFGRPLYRVSAFLVDGLLVDTGCPAVAREFDAWCRSQAIDRVVLTHHHEDHAGGAALLAARGVPVAAPALTAELVADPYRLPLYRAIVWGQPRAVAAEPLGPRLETTRHRFEVLPTPGHAADHVCLFEPHEGWLFSGDLYIAPRVVYLRNLECADTILASLRRVLALDPGTLVCSHAGVIREPRRVLERRIAHWEELRGRARELRQGGWSVARITRALLGREGTMTWLSRGEFAKVNLILSLLGEPNPRPPLTREPWAGAGPRRDT